ncbi:MAG TPA: prephenate dehydrogenase/arogenate dehydrogenase family protein [Chloroflexota bacterium]|nr:prephenate dehydrogenase/arogenate dehydrogenase family protein [Chloroflexota bacterium]
MAEKPVAAVLGVGGVGGELASQLRGAGIFSSVIGWDPDFDTARAAQKRGVADRYVNVAPEAARQAAVLFLGLRGERFTEALTAIGPNLRQGAVVCSLQEAHEPATAAAARALPGNVNFVNADPIRWGQDGEPASFVKGVWCISPAVTAHEDAVGFVAHVGERLGMEALFLDAREHDALAAGARLMPALLAAALLRVASAQSSWREMGRVAGTELRDATLLVGEDPAGLGADLAASREHAVRWLDLLLAELAQLRDGLKDGQEPADYFSKAQEARMRWLHERALPAQAADLPRVTAEKRSLLRPF